jgi:hypothetical protein
MIANLLRDHAGDLVTIRQNFPWYRSQAESALRDVPADDPDVMLPPQSPFQTYLLLLAICSTTTTRLELFDPYLYAEIFHRYLPDVHTGVFITLVTEEASMRKERPRSRILSISELVAMERPAHYQLLEAKSIHDRHIRADNKIYHIGGSAKDASKKDFYTITETDSNAVLHVTLDRIIAGSSPWYKPGMLKHRRWCARCNQPSDVEPNGTCNMCGAPP